MSSPPTRDEVRAHIRLELDHGWAASDDHELHGPDPDAVREVERAERWLTPAVAAAPEAFEALAVGDKDASVRARALAWLRPHSIRDGLLRELATDPAPAVAGPAQTALAARLERFDALIAIFEGAARGARASITKAMLERDAPRAVEVILARAGAVPEDELARLLARALADSDDEGAQEPLLELALAGFAPVSRLDDAHARSLLERAPPIKLLRAMANDPRFAAWPTLQRALLARAGEDHADLALMGIAPDLRAVTLPRGLELRIELAHDHEAALARLAAEEPAPWIAGALVAHLRTVGLFKNDERRRHFRALTPAFSRLGATTLIAALETQRFPWGFDSPRVRDAFDLLIQLGPDVNAWLDRAIVGLDIRHLVGARVHAQYR